MSVSLHNTPAQTLASSIADTNPSYTLSRLKESFINFKALGTAKFNKENECKSIDTFLVSLCRLRMHSWVASVIRTFSPLGSARASTLPSCNDDKASWQSCKVYQKNKKISLISIKGLLFKCAVGTVQNKIR